MNKITTRTANIFKDENDIVHIIILDGIKMDYEDALDNFLVIRNLSESKKILKLIDARSNWTIKKKARDFIARKDVEKKTLARAVIRGSFLNKILLNFFILLSKPKAPTKIFDNYTDGYNWLLSLKENELKNEQE